MVTYSCPEDVVITGSYDEAFSKILTPDALSFVATLTRQFSPLLKELLELRSTRQKAIDNGSLPDFLPETAHIRKADWTISPLPHDLQDRRVEITGPASDRKMVINALNSGAKVFMADFEDANSPTWINTIQGQCNLYDAIRRDIEFTNPDGRQYTLHDHIATLVVRPRGWHLLEKHILVDGSPVPAGILDFALYVYHNAFQLLSANTGPYFYLPKLESHREARLWNDLFTTAETVLGLDHGVIKATVLIETILAAFEMDEILYELRDHSVGLNCGRWDYIFSYIKKLRHHEHVILPDRSQVTMTVPFLRAYTQLTVKTCHRRGASAIGGMAAQIPIKHDALANEEALARVRTDKEREARDGHDGTWVAHPGLVPVAMEVFDAWMKTPNQLDILREDVHVTAEDLLAVPEGSITEAGLRLNVSVCIQYIEAWLRGYGAVPIFNLMEDAATAEISRAQVWQWIRHKKGLLEDGRKVTVSLVKQVLNEELATIKRYTGDTYTTGKWNLAKDVVWQLLTADDFIEFLTIPGYAVLD